MDRVRKLEIISAIASRLDNELGQLKDWIRSELDASIDELGKSHDLDQDQQDLEEKPQSSPSPSQLNEIEINPQIVIETMDIKNEIEDQDEETKAEENDEFILGGGYRSSSRLRARSTTIDYSEYQSDFTKQEEQTDDEEYQETSNTTTTTAAILNPISLSSSTPPFKYIRTRSRNRYNSFFNSNNENSPLKKLLSKLVHREKLPKIPKRPANFCSTCLLTFETHQLYKDHQQIHFKVPENHKFIESQRGNPLLEADGYYYRKTVGTPNAIYWQCRVIENGVKCYARATSSLDGERVRLTGEHKHEKKPRKAPSLRTIKRRLKFQGPASTSEYLGENLGEFYNQNHESTSSSSSTSNYQQKQQKQQPASSYNPIKNIEVLIPRDDFVHQLYGSGNQNSSASATTKNTTTKEQAITSSTKKPPTETEIETESLKLKSPKQVPIKDKDKLQPQVNISISSKIFNENENEKHQVQDSPPSISISDRIFNSNSNSQQSTNASSISSSNSTIPTTTTSNNNTQFSSNMDKYKEHHQMPFQPIAMPHSMPITNPSVNINSSSNSSSTSNRYFNYYDQYHHQNQNVQSSTNNINLNMNRYFSNDQQGHFNSSINRILNNDYQANNAVHGQVMNNNANSILDALNQHVNSYSIPPSIFDDFAKHHQSQ